MIKSVFSCKVRSIDHIAAWLAVIFLFAATLLYCKPDLPPWMQIFNVLFQLTFIVHTICSIYRFGFPPLKRN